jgi:hypothetical protein
MSLSPPTAAKMKTQIFKHPFGMGATMNAPTTIAKKKIPVLPRTVSHSKRLLAGSEFQSSAIRTFSYFESIRPFLRPTKGSGYANLVKSPKHFGFFN